MTKFPVAAILLAALILPIGADRAAAHPHAWIDMKIAVVFDEKGRAIALKQEWLFDDFYTAYATEGLAKGKDGKPAPEKLDALARENLKNLTDYGWFTEVKTESARTPIAAVADVASGMVGNRMVMKFTATLKTPIDPREGPFLYSIYDPTYFVEMVHAKGKDAIRLIDAPKGCRAELQKSDPDPQMALLAAGLDRNQQAPDTLGAAFAERVAVRCD